MNEETMPAKKEETSLDLLSNRKPVPGMENFGPEDLAVPIIKLIQGTSDVKAGRPGQFINTVTNEVNDHANLVLITYAKEEKDWNDGKGPKPQYKFLALDPDKKTPVILYVGGTSLWNAKAYLNIYWQQGVPLWHSVTGVVSKQKDNKQGLGKYYVMEFEAMRDTTNEERALYYGFYDKYGRKMIDSKFEEDVEAVAGVTDIPDEEVNIADVPV